MGQAAWVCVPTQPLTKRARPAELHFLESSIRRQMGVNLGRASEGWCELWMGEYWESAQPSELPNKCSLLLAVGRRLVDTLRTKCSLESKKSSSLTLSTAFMEGSGDTFQKRGEGRGVNSHAGVFLAGTSDWPIARYSPGERVLGFRFNKGSLNSFCVPGTAVQTSPSPIQSQSTPSAAA